MREEIYSQLYFAFAQNEGESALPTNKWLLGAGFWRMFVYETL